MDEKSSPDIRVVRIKEEERGKKKKEKERRNSYDFILYFFFGRKTLKRIGDIREWVLKIVLLLRHA